MQRVLCRGGERYRKDMSACLFHTLSLLERFESATVRMMKANFALVSLRDDSVLSAFLRNGRVFN